MAKKSYFMKVTKKTTVLMIVVVALVGTACKGTRQTEVQVSRVILGDEQFDEYVPLLSGKRVALFSNHTGIVGD